MFPQTLLSLGDFFIMQTLTQKSKLGYDIKNDRMEASGNDSMLC